MKTQYSLILIFVTIFSIGVNAERPTLWSFDCSTEPDTIYYSWTASPLEDHVTFTDGIMTINSTTAIYPRIPFDQAYDITGYPTAKIRLKTSVPDKRLKLEMRKFGQNTSGSPIGGAFYVPLTGDGEWHELTVNLTGDNYVGNIGLSFRNAADDGFASGIFEIDYIYVGGPIIATSLPAENKAEHISLIPTSDGNELRIKSTDKDIELSIFTITGTKCKTLRGKSQLTADLSNLPCGIYLATLKSAGCQVSKRFVKE